VILFEPKLHLGGHVIVPDLAGWHTDRYERKRRPFHTVAPNWCCEIVSPSSRSRDRIAKSRIYAQQGVGDYWILDPIARELEAFERLDSGQWAVVGMFEANERVRIRPFDAAELDVGTLWEETE
jgi:Uma2 family endonuclease